MTIPAIIIGAVLGAFLFKFRGINYGGFLLGGLLGYLLARLYGLERHVMKLNESVRLLIQAQSATRVGKADKLFDSATSRPEPEEQTPSGTSAPAASGPSEPESSGVYDWLERKPEPGDLDLTGGHGQSGRSQTGRAGQQETLVDKLLLYIKPYFTGATAVVSMGVVILFFGVAFLVKYAAERGMLPIELRLASVAIGGILMLGIGWRLRHSRRAYALVLEGGGTGLIYLTVFSALRLYQLIPASMAFGILAALCVFSAAMAVLQDARSLAVLGISGGFLAPVLTSTGAGNHVMLFSYYLLLNAGIFGIAWFKAWRILNLVGFLFTFGISAAWAAGNYRPEFFASTEPFLIAFFLFYWAISVMFAGRQPPRLKGYVDGTLVFGLPMVAFGYQSVLVHPYEYGLAWSALGLGLCYSVLAWGIFRKGSQNLSMLSEAFLSISVVFATVAIPLALDARWTTAAWAMEGAAVYWIGDRQERVIARLFGMALQVAGGLAFLNELREPTGALPVLNGVYLGGLILSLSGLFIGFYLYSNTQKLRSLEKGLDIPLLVIGLGWWLFSGINEIHVHAPEDYQVNFSLIFITLSVLIAGFAGERLAWSRLGLVTRGLLFVMIGFAGFLALENKHFLPYAGYVAWPLAFAAQYYSLWRMGKPDEPGGFRRYLYMGTLWLLVFVVTFESWWWVDHWLHGTGVWAFVAWGLIPAGFVLAISHAAGQSVSASQSDSPPSGRRRFMDHLSGYLYGGLAPVAGYLILWTFAANLITKGDPSPLPYVPLFNPLDLAGGLVFLVLAYWLFALWRHKMMDFAGLWGSAYTAAVAAALFVWFNAVIVRTLHYWGHVPFTYTAMNRSDLAQTTVSLCWTLLALVLMFLATRKRLRIVWISGAVMLAVVVIKLFTVDLSNTGTIERIVSFISVGVLLLVIGYLSPLPPQLQKEEAGQ